MLVSADAALVEHARKLSTQARDPAPHYEHSEIGFNYRLSNVLAALGRAQLAVLPERVAARRRINERYRELLADAPGITFMPEAGYGAGNQWLTCVVVDPEAFGADRETIRLALEEQDIEARPVWKPMHLQPVYAAAPMFGGAGVRGAVRAWPLPAERLVADDRRPGPSLRRRSRRRPDRLSLRYASAGTTSTTSSQCDQRSVRPLTVSRYACWISLVTGPTPSSWSSTARTGVTSAAVPVMKNSSAR